MIEFDYFEKELGHTVTTLLRSISDMKIYDFEFVEKFNYSSKKQRTITKENGSRLLKILW